MTIQLIGYKPIIKNSFYVQDVSVNKKGQISSVLLLSRYREPTEDQIVKLFVNAAREILKTGYIENNLEKLIAKFPAGIISLITYREKHIIKSVRAYSPALDVRPVEASERCVFVKQGFIEADSINQKCAGDLMYYANRVSTQNDPKNRLGWKISFKLILDEYGNLPDKKVINFLIREGAIHSDRLKIISGRVDHKDLEEITDNVYTALPTQHYVSKLKDISKNVLEESAILTACRLLDYFEDKKAKFAEIESIIRSRFFGKYQDSSNTAFLNN